MARTGPELTDEIAEATEPSPRARRVAKTRRAIIDAARALFDEQGYDGTTIDQIADRADIAPRTFFRYFPSKEALVFADFDELRQVLFPILEARPRNEPPLRSLVVALAEFAGTIEEQHDRLAWGFNLSRQHQGLLDYEISALKAETAGRVTAFLAERLGVDAETDPRPHVWTMVTMTLFARAVHSTVGEGHGGQHGSVGEAFLALVADTASDLRSAVPR